VVGDLNAGKAEAWGIAGVQEPIGASAARTLHGRPVNQNERRRLSMACPHRSVRMSATRASSHPADLDSRSTSRISRGRRDAPVDRAKAVRRAEAGSHDSRSGHCSERRDVMSISTYESHADSARPPNKLAPMGPWPIGANFKEGLGSAQTRQRPNGPWIP
jgi:hypothetical protein